MDDTDTGPPASQGSGTHIALPDPPGTTRLAIIAARLRGDRDEVDRLLALGDQE